MAKKQLEDPDVNMTPMIDVVFQLMIFFIVTIKMNEAVNEDIIMEDAINGPIIQDIEDPRLFIIEVDRRGRVTVHGRELSVNMLKQNLYQRRKRYGTAQFPVMIRADFRAKHQDVRKALDACTESGVWQINFMAVKEHKATAGRHKGPKGGGLIRK